VNGGGGKTIVAYSVFAKEMADAAVACEVITLQHSLGKAGGREISATSLGLC